MDYQHFQYFMRSGVQPFANAAQMMEMANKNNQMFYNMNMQKQREKINKGNYLFIYKKLILKNNKLQ